MKLEKMTNHTNESLKKGMITGFKGIFTISDFFSKPLKPVVFKLSLGLSLLFCGLIYAFDIMPLEAIQEIKSLLLNFLPGILGFTIGGYGFLIGFIQPNLMDRISEPRNESIFSLFQLASASFACNILIQGISLCITYFIHFITWIDDKKNISVRLPEFYISFINAIGLITMSVAFSFSVSVVLQLVVNVFNFSQLHHYHHNKIKLDKKIEAFKSARTLDDNSTEEKI